MVLKKAWKWKKFAFILPDNNTGVTLQSSLKEMAHLVLNVSVKFYLVVDWLIATQLVYDNFNATAYLM